MIPGKDCRWAMGGMLVLATLFIVLRQWDAKYLTGNPSSHELFQVVTTRLAKGENITNTEPKAKIFLKMGET